MAFSPTSAALVALLSVVLWHTLRSRIVRTDIDNIAGPPSESFWKGNFGQLFNINAWDFHQRLAQQYGRVLKIHGFFGGKHLYVFDPKALHHIVVKNLYVFDETDSFFAINRVIFGHGLSSARGEHHRKQRKMLNPVFSIAHMRNLIPAFYGVAHNLGKTLNEKVFSGPQEIDLLHWMSRTALELIGQSGFGYSFDSLTENAEPHRYSVAVKDLVPVMFKFVLLRSFSPTLVKLGPPKFRKFIVDSLPSLNVKRFRDIVAVMDATSREIYAIKKRAFEQGEETVSQQVGGGKDIMTILMQANLEASEEDRLSDDEVLAQDRIRTFTFAGMDTTSNALSRILYLLSRHQDVQEKLRSEIMQAQEKYGDLQYDELDKLPLLDAVCRETLRLYPPISTLQRITRQDAILPFSKPIRGLDGRELAEIVVPKGTNIIMSIFNINRDPAIWGSDSCEWKPERWLSPLPESVTSAGIPGVYANLMTFIGGGRACIGFKFSQLEMKVVLSVLVSQLRFSAKQEIAWEMGPIAIPTVKGKAGKAQLPLLVERV